MSFVKHQEIAANLPMAVLVGLVFFAGQLLQLRGLASFTPTDCFVASISFLLASFIFASTCVLFCGLLDDLWGGYASAAGWMIALSISTIYFWDHFSYLWLGLHLDDAVPLLSQNVQGDFHVMRRSLIALFAVLAAYSAQLIVGTFGARWLFRRFSIFQNSVRLRRVVYLLILLAFGYGIEQAIAPHTMTPRGYEARADSIWQFKMARGVGTPTPLLTRAQVEFPPRPSEAAIEQALSSISPQSVERPLNVFLFVVDSLRADFITPEYAPNLSHLRQLALPLEHGVAAGNCTHVSWYSILNSSYPVYWSSIAHQRHSAGAIPIRALRKAGYAIHADATPLLSYFGFAHSVFGDDEKLANSISDQSTFFGPQSGDTVGDIDKHVVQRVIDSLDQVTTTSRVFYLIMLDAPHYNYSWARDYRPKFVPFMSTVPLLPNYITSENVGELKNRYADAVNFEDQLIGSFMAKMQQRNLMDDSIIVVTGDHGEEFLENGHVVHSSALDRFQIEVPIIVYAPAQIAEQRPIAIASHIDIFPTIFDLLGLRHVPDLLLNGTSMLRRSPDTISMSAMCSSYSPSKLLISDSTEKVFLDFSGGMASVGSRLIGREMVATQTYDANYRRTGVSDTAHGITIVNEALRQTGASPHPLYRVLGKDQPVSLLDGNRVR